MDGEPLSGENVSLTGIDSQDALLPSQSEELTDGSASFTVEQGRHVVTVDLADVTLRKRVETDANGTYDVSLEAGSLVAGTVLKGHSPLSGADVALKNSLGTVANTTADTNGTFEFSPVLLDQNLTVEVTHQGYPFTSTATAGDEDVVVSVNDPITSDEDMDYRLTQDSPLHSGRMAIVDFSRTPPTVHDYFNVHNPASRPFSGTVAIDVPEGATVDAVTTLDNQPLQYAVESGEARINFSVSPETSRPIGIHYTVPASSLTLTADRFTGSAMVYMTAGDASADQFTLEGPLSMQDPVDMGQGRTGFVATGSNLTQGEQFGVSFTGSAGSTAPTGGSTGDDSTTSTFLAIGAALLIIAGLVYTKQGGELSGSGLKDSLESIGAPLGEESTAGGAAASAAEKSCPECGTEASGSFCPECGSELRHEQGSQTPDYCPGCGDEVRDATAYCPGCGQEL